MQSSGNEPALSAGRRFRLALEKERPLQVVGAINALAAKLAEQVGFRALYLSGAGVSNASFGLPDLGLTTLANVVEDTRRITAACPLPLLVDADTGWEETSGVKETVCRLASAGAAGLHLEDQDEGKRCGHRPNKSLISTSKMADRIHTAAAARPDPDFVLMARTDALASEGLDKCIERSKAYVEAGADMIFAEAFTELDQYRALARSVEVPILANITEFGKNPLFTSVELEQADVRIVLHPLSAFRAMNAAALRVFETIRREGSPDSVVGTMQTRQALYDLLDYENHERELEKIRAQHADKKLK